MPFSRERFVAEEFLVLGTGKLNMLPRLWKNAFEVCNAALRFLQFMPDSSSAIPTDNLKLRRISEVFADF